MHADYALVFPGTQNLRHEVLHVPGEGSHGDDASSPAKVAWGSGSDLAGTNLAVLRLVIIGHGAFALEVMRHALTQQAASVVMVARHVRHVLPLVYTLLEKMSQFIEKSATIELLRRMYALLGRNASDLAVHDYSGNQDLYYLAQAVGKLRVVQGQVRWISGRRVGVSTGETFAVDVLVKATGFSRDSVFDAAIAWPRRRFPSLAFVDKAQRVYLDSSDYLKENSKKEPDAGAFMPKLFDASANLLTANFVCDIAIRLSTPEAQNCRTTNSPTDQRRDALRVAFNHSLCFPRTCLSNIELEVRSREWNWAAILDRLAQQWAYQNTLLGGPTIPYPYTFEFIAELAAGSKKAAQKREAFFRKHPLRLPRTSMTPAAELV
jgi:cation diffusion facilitator CzcD-associated flavoprotein CzcO